MKRIKLQDLADMVQQGKLHADQYCYRCAKVLYATRQEASRSASEQRSALERTSCLRPYPCPHGHGWHLTSMKQPEHPMHRRRRHRQEKRAKAKQERY